MLHPLALKCCQLPCNKTENMQNVHKIWRQRKSSFRLMTIMIESFEVDESFLQSHLINMWTIMCIKYPLCIRYEFLKLISIHILVLCNSLADKIPTFQRNIVPLFSIWQTKSAPSTEMPVPIYKIRGHQDPNTQYSESHKSNMISITVQFTFNSDKWNASEPTCHSPQYHVTTLFLPDYLGLPHGDGIQHPLLL